LKYRVWEERRKMKEKAEEEYRRAKEEGKLEDMYKYAKRVNYLDSKIIDNSKRYTIHRGTFRGRGSVFLYGKEGRRLRSC